MADDRNKKRKNERTVSEQPQTIDWVVNKLCEAYPHHAPVLIRQVVHEAKKEIPPSEVHEKLLSHAAFKLAVKPINLYPILLPTNIKPLDRIDRAARTIVLPQSPTGQVSVLLFSAAAI